MAKGLGKHSFLKSAEEYENRGVNFVRFVAKSEKSEEAEMGRAGREWVWRGRNPSRLPSCLRASRVNMRDDSTKVTDCQ
jgi:hypothetical protein